MYYFRPGRDTRLNCSQVAPFAEDIIGVSASNSMNLLLVMNAVGVPGRLVPVIVADRWLGPVNTLIVFVLFRHPHLLLAGGQDAE